MLDRHDRRFDVEGKRRNLLRAVVAMAVDTVAMPLRAGNLLPFSGVCCTPRIGRDRGGSRDFGGRLAGNGVNRTAEHDTQQQQESCDVRDVPKTEPK